MDGQKVLETAINHYRLGSELKRIGNTEMASHNYRAAIKICQDRPYLRKVRGGAYFHLACMYQDQQDNRQAKIHLQKCLAIYPEHRKAQATLEELKS